MRDQRLHKNARQLRAQMTDAERRLWSALRLRQLGGARFRRQHVIGPYIVDFACIEQQLAIEVDGGQHLHSEDDRVRDTFLAGRGWRALRFWNDQVLKETTAVIEAIWLALSEQRGPCPHPNPPPQAGEGVTASFRPPQTGERGNPSSLPRETGQGHGGGRR